MNDVFCGNCGTSYAEDVEFCTECGVAKPSGENAPTPAPAPAPAPAPEIPREQELAAAGLVHTPEVAAEIVNEIAAETPPQPAPAPAPAPEKSTEVHINMSQTQEQAVVLQKSVAPVSKGKKIAFAILSVLISLTLLTTLTLTQIAAIAVYALNPQTLSKMARVAVGELNFGEVEVGGLVRDSAVDLPDFGRVYIYDSSTLADVLYNSIHDYYINEYNITPNSLRELLAHERFNEFVAKIAESGVMFLLERENLDSPVVSSSEIMQFVTINSALIKETTGFSFADDPEYNEILRETLSRSEINRVTWRNIEEEAMPTIVPLRNNYNRLRTAAPIVLGVSIGLSVLLIAGLVLLNRRKITNAMLYLGLPSVLSGIGVIITSQLGGLVIGRLTTAATIGTAGLNGFGAIETGLKSAISVATSSLMLVGIIVVVLGIVMIAVKIIVAASTPKKAIAFEAVMPAETPEIAEVATENATPEVITEVAPEIPSPEAVS